MNDYYDFIYDLHKISFPKPNINPHLKFAHVYIYLCHCMKDIFFLYIIIIYSSLHSTINHYAGRTEEYIVQMSFDCSLYFFDNNYPPDKKGLVWSNFKGCTSHFVQSPSNLANKALFIIYILTLNYLLTLTFLKAVDNIKCLFQTHFLFTKISSGWWCAHAVIKTIIW